MTVDEKTEEVDVVSEEESNGWQRSIRNAIFSAPTEQVLNSYVARLFDGQTDLPGTASMTEVTCERAKVFMEVVREQLISINTQLGETDREGASKQAVSDPATCPFVLFEECPLRLLVLDPEKVIDHELAHINKANELGVETLSFHFFVHLSNEQRRSKNGLSSRRTVMTGGFLPALPDNIKPQDFFEISLAPKRPSSSDFLSATQLLLASGLALSAEERKRLSEIYVAKVGNLSAATRKDFCSQVAESLDDNATANVFFCGSAEAVLKVIEEYGQTG